jgi:nitrous oxidase accessory protein
MTPRRLATALLVLVWTLRAAAAQHALPPGGAAPNAVQRAIDAASPGDTILVPAGTYAGNLTVRKRMTILGAGGPVLLGSGMGSVVTITADSCVLEGFVVEHSGAMLVNEDAGVLLKCAGSVVRKNVLRDVLFGIYLMHAERNTVADNEITGRKQLEFGERGSGIHIWNSEHNRFTGNRITDVRDGFYIQNASHSWIEGNEAFGIRYGLHYMYADSNTFLGNSFHDNIAGAAIMYSRGIVMRNNVFAHNRGFTSFGILFQDCHGLTADSNVVADNVIGMFFEASTDNSFRHNVVAQNDIGLEMFQNSTNNSFTENNFIDNLNPLAIVGKRTESRWSVGGRGNYWSGYDGYDLDGDGVGDIPMKIQNVFQYIEGQHANVRVYLYSPASQALAVASKAFPIIRINEEADDRPLMRPFDMRSMPAVRMAGPPADRSVPGGGRGAEAWFAAPALILIAIGVIMHRLTRRPL